jgi:hypothetical protein
MKTGAWRSGVLGAMCMVVLQAAVVGVGGRVCWGAEGLAVVEVKVGVKELAWQQVSERLVFTGLMERERYTTLDKSARSVLGVEVGKGGPGLETLRVEWAVRALGVRERVVARGTEKIGSGMVEVNIGLGALGQGPYEVSASLVQGSGEGEKKLAEFKGGFEYAAVEAPAQEGRVALLLPRGMPLAGQTYPVQTGVPFPKGALWNAEQVRVVDGGGRVVPSGVTVRSKWGSGDASVRWLGVDFQASTARSSWMAGGGGKDGKDVKDGGYFLEFGPKVNAGKGNEKVLVTETANGVMVDTGAVSFEVKRKGFNVIDQVKMKGRPAVESGVGRGLYLVDHEGAVYRAANDPDVKVTVEEKNDLRVVVRAEGWYVKDGTRGEKMAFTLPTDRLCRFVTRIEAYAGKPYVRVQSTWINTFDTFSVRLRDLGISLPFKGAKEAMFGVEGGQAQKAEVSEGGVRLVQHLHDQFVVENGKGGEIAKGKQSAGWVVAQGASGGLAVSHRDTWQRFPKEIEVLADEVRLHVWPAHGREHAEIKPMAWDQLHRLWFAHQGRELNMRMPWDNYFAVAEIYNDASDSVYKAAGHALIGVHASGMGVGVTSDLLVHFAGEGEGEKLEQVAKCFQVGPHALADPQWICDSLAMGYMHPYDPVRFPGQEETISDFMRGYWDTQNAGKMFGMWIYRSWHHSDYKGDGRWNLYRLYNGSHHHEAVMPWMMYARSGDPFYLTQGMANIRQLADVQIIHHDAPGYAQKEFHNHQGRLVGSTKHDDSLSPWGGDHAILGHPTCYTGLMLAYYLTGDLRLREVVVEEWQKTLVSDRANPEYHMADLTRFVHARLPGSDFSKDIAGRDNANPVSELLELYQLTYDSRVLMVLSPRLDKWLKGGMMMPDWGQPLQNVLLFYGSQAARKALLEAVADYRSTNGRPKIHTSGIWSTGLITVSEPFALAGILEPKSPYAADAFLFSSGPHARGYGMMMACIEPDLVLSPTADMVRFIPRMMYSLAHSSRSDLAPMLGDSQPMPHYWSPERPVRCVVREDKDQEIKVQILGRVHQAEGAEVQAFGPDGKLISRNKAPAGLHDPFTLVLPADGKTGEYTLLIKATQADDLLVPLTSLPEVYVAGAWVTANMAGDNRPHPARFFTRPRGNEPCEVLIEGERAKLFGADRRTLLGNGKEKAFSVRIGTEGAWVWNWMGGVSNSYVADKAPLILSVSPDRWFAPTGPGLTLQAVP